MSDKIKVIYGRVALRTRLWVFTGLVLTIPALLMLTTMFVDFLGTHGMEPVVIKNIGRGNIATGYVLGRKRP